MLIRDPKSVRTWPQQVMPGFTQERLSDADLDAVIAYLGAMARSALRPRQHISFSPSFSWGSG